MMVMTWKPSSVKINRIQTLDLMALLSSAFHPIHCYRSPYIVYMSGCHRSAGGDLTMLIVTITYRSLKCVIIRQLVILVFHNVTPYDWWWSYIMYTVTARGGHNHYSYITDTMDKNLNIK